jgi:aspartate aminotransferase
VEAFKGGIEIEEYLLNARRILSGLGNECVKILRDAGVKVHNPTGGFYLFLDFSAHNEKLNNRGITSSQELCEALLDETGVAILHGSSFSRPEKEMTARMAYVDFDGARALSMAKTTPLNQPLDPDFNKYYCARVIEGVTAMANWLKSL